MNGVAPDRMGVYRLLNRLEEQGLVSHAWTDSEEGPSKRIYELTASGRNCLTEWINTLDEYKSNIERLIEMMKKCGQIDSSKNS